MKARKYSNEIKQDIFRLYSENEGVLSNKLYSKIKKKYKIPKKTIMSWIQKEKWYDRHKEIEFHSYRLMDEYLIEDRKNTIAHLINLRKSLIMDAYKVPAKSKEGAVGAIIALGKTIKEELGEAYMEYAEKKIFNEMLSILKEIPEGEIVVQKLNEKAKQLKEKEIEPVG